MMLSPRRIAEIRELMADAALSPRLTRYEEGFVYDMRNRVSRDGAALQISEAQEKVLRDIETKVYACG